MVMLIITYRNDTTNEEGANRQRKYKVEDF